MGPEFFWWGGMWIFPLLMLIIMLVIVYAVFIRGGFRAPWHEGQKEDSETALEILKKRYAKGEIPKEEFQEMKKNLE
jgi:putative membrane protein